MISTIGQLLNTMGVHSRVFDLGRHITELPSKHFQSFEAGTTPYPAPYLHHAWIGLLFWEPDSPQAPLLWFLKFPLDEQGKLQLAERDLFLKQLLTAVGTNIEAVKEGKQLQAVLEGNPFVFTPTPERQACLHAKIKLLLQQAPSNHYEKAVDYLSGDLNQWQELGIQGLADLSIRWQEHQDTLVSAVPNMPAEPLKSLCLCLENESINGKVSKALVQRLNTESGNSELCAGLIRALSRSQAADLRHKQLLQLLTEQPPLDVEVLAAIATRCHLDLCEANLCQAFLQKLAEQPQETFNRVMLDLLFLPLLRPHLLAVFRSPERNQALASAIGGLMGQPNATMH